MRSFPPTGKEHGADDVVEQQKRQKSARQLATAARPQLRDALLGRCEDAFHDDVALLAVRLTK